MCLHRLHYNMQGAWQSTINKPTRNQFHNTHTTFGSDMQAIYQAHD
jgi:hypothetical protein